MIFINYKNNLAKNQKTMYTLDRKVDEINMIKLTNSKNGGGVY